MAKKQNEVSLQIMEKIKSLNKKHKLILEHFFNEVDRFVYDITEDQKSEMFQNFILLKRKAKLLHNTLGANINNDERISKTEWVFMLPNFLMFGAFGFALALKNKSNGDLIELHIHELFEEMTDTIHDLDKMLDAHFVELEATTTLEEIMKKKQTKKTN